MFWITFTSARYQWNAIHPEGYCSRFDLGNDPTSLGCIQNASRCLILILFCFFFFLFYKFRFYSHFDYLFFILFFIIKISLPNALTRKGFHLCHRYCSLNWKQMVVFLHHLSKTAWQCIPAVLQLLSLYWICHFTLPPTSHSSSLNES